MAGASHPKNHLPDLLNRLRNPDQSLRNPDQGLRSLDQGLRNLDQSLQNANQGLRSPHQVLIRLFQQVFDRQSAKQRCAF